VAARSVRSACPVWSIQHCLFKVGGVFLCHRSLIHPFGR